MSETCWKCHCGRETPNPQAFALHRAACTVSVPRDWFDGWQGVELDGLPRAGRSNNGPTPPGEVISGWL